MRATTAGLNQLKQIDENLYDKLQKSSFFIEFFKSLFIIQYVDEPNATQVEKIALFILKHFSLVQMNGACVICRCQEECEGIKSNTCNHMYCKKCYHKWSNINMTCPECRASPFIPYQLGSSY